MKIEVSSRGYQHVLHPEYLDETKVTRLISQSSAIGDYEDAMDRPGSSFLWIGANHHLNREQVAELKNLLALWLESGNFKGE